MIIGEYCDVFPPQLDGVGTVVRAYAEELTRAGEICYYAAPYGEASETYSFRTLLYHSVKMIGEPYRIGFPQLDSAYHRAVREIPFDLVHAHSPFAAGHAALELARARHIPIVATFHSKYYDDFYQKTHSAVLSEQLVQRVVHFYRQCDEVWTVNRATAAVLHEYGYDGEIQIMENGTNPWTTPADRAAVNRRFGLTDGETVFLFVGQMNWKKNIREILDGLHELQIPFRLMLVGQGPDDAEIRAAAAECIPGRAIFTGHITDRALLHHIYARADLFLFPSKYDNAPMVVREAAAAGTPSVLVRGSCASEGIRDGENGFLCADDPADFCRAVRQALPLAQTVGECARRTVPKPWPKIIGQVRARYRALIEANAER